jgi:hypothetical protein
VTFDAYRQLEQEAAKPKRLTDHSAAWRQMTPISGINGSTGDRIQAFADSKRITLDALDAMGTRVKLGDHGSIELAWACETPEGVTAVKLRPLDPQKPRHALAPSTFVQPIVIGDTTSLDWFVAEGETDAARLYDLIGDIAAVLVLPAGALTFKDEWAGRIPRGATMHLCHDADDAGDEGAAKAATTLGGKTVRVRPPDGVKDWCDWAGGRDEFVALVGAARAARAAAVEFVSIEEFVANPVPQADPIVVDADGSTVISADGFGMTYGDGGAGKTTFWMDGSMHFAAGDPWLNGLLIPARPLKVGWVENEGPHEEFRRKLERKLAAWGDRLPPDGFHILKQPWGALDLRLAEHREGVAAAIRTLDLDILFLGPLNDLGMEGGGTPDEVRAFHAHIRDVQKLAERLVSLMLLHHENAAGRISGAWTGRPDLLVHVTAQGNGKTRVLWHPSSARRRCARRPRSRMTSGIASILGR